MIKNIFHLTLITLVWKRYKTAIVSTLLLFLYFWLVGLIHADYLSYSELNNESSYIGSSFIIKWLCFALGVLIYLLYNSHFFTKAINRQKPAAAKPKLETKNVSLESQQEDPFAQIRQRDKLRSKADFIIEKNKLD